MIDKGQKMITKAHPWQSTCELRNYFETKNNQASSCLLFYFWLYTTYCTFVLELNIVKPHCIKIKLSINKKYKLQTNRALNVHYKTTLENTGSVNGVLHKWGLYIIDQANSQALLKQ